MRGRWCIHSLCVCVFAGLGGVENRRIIGNVGGFHPVILRQ